MKDLERELELAQVSKRSLRGLVCGKDWYVSIGISLGENNELLLVLYVLKEYVEKVQMSISHFHGYTVKVCEAPEGIKALEDTQA